jgi:hypothetical protein
MTGPPNRRLISPRRLSSASISRTNRNSSSGSMRARRGNLSEWPLRKQASQPPTDQWLASDPGPSAVGICLQTCLRLTGDKEEGGTAAEGRPRTIWRTLAAAGAIIARRRAAARPTRSAYPGEGQGNAGCMYDNGLSCGGRSGRSDTLGYGFKGQNSDSQFPAEWVKLVVEPIRQHYSRRSIESRVLCVSENSCDVLG